MKRIESCADHAPRVAGYVEAYLDAERRLERGEKQYRCGECGLWSWPYEPALTGAEEAPNNDR